MSVSFAQLSFGRRAGRVVFFAAWREKATGLYLQGGGATVVCKGIRTSPHAGDTTWPALFDARCRAVIFDDLRAIQLRYGFLPKAELEAFSQRSHTPLYQIHSVASFYPHFQLAPPPKADVRVGASLDKAHSPSTDDYYPDVSRRLEEVGVVVINVCLDDAGKMTGPPKVQTTSKSPRLDDAAVRWGSHARFIQGTLNGKPVAGCTAFRVRFQLTGDK